MAITDLSALELGRKIKSGEISSEEAVKAQLKRIKEVDKEYSCYVTVLEEEAIQDVYKRQVKSLG